MISRGVELRKQGADEAALASFQKAYGLAKSPRALAQAALAEQALGRWVDAEAHLAQAILRGDDPWVARNKSLLEQALSEIQDHLGFLELSGDVAGAEVRLNNVVVGTLPLKAPIRTLAGSAALQVRAEGYLPVVRTVIVPIRGLARESVVLVASGPSVKDRSPASNTATALPMTAVGAKESPGVATAPASWSPRRKFGVALGATAVASLGLGTTFLFIREGRARDFNSERCTTADPQPGAACRSLQDKVDSAFTVGVVGLVGAAVLGGAATYLFLTDHPGDKSAATFALRCSPTGHAGVTCMAEF